MAKAQNSAKKFKKLEKLVKKIEEKGRKRVEKFERLSRFTDNEHKELRKMLTEKILEILKSKTDKFRWLYSPYRGCEKVFTRDKLIREIEKNTPDGREYIAEICRLIESDLEND